MLERVLVTEHHLGLPTSNVECGQEGVQVFRHASILNTSSHARTRAPLHAIFTASNHLGADTRERSCLRHRPLTSRGGAWTGSDRRLAHPGVQPTTRLARGISNCQSQNTSTWLSSLQCVCVPAACRTPGGLLVGALTSQEPGVMSRGSGAQGGGCAVWCRRRRCPGRLT
jgi:hypothetical protein